MSKKVMIKMLDQGSNGFEILKILDAITNVEQCENEPTLEEIDF